MFNDRAHNEVLGLKSRVVLAVNYRECGGVRTSGS